MSQGKVVKVSGPLVVASGMEEANMFDVVDVYKRQSDNKVMINDGGSIIFIEAEKMGDNNIKLKKMDRKTMDICL